MNASVYLDYIVINVISNVTASRIKIIITPFFV